MLISRCQGAEILAEGIMTSVRHRKHAKSSRQSMSRQAKEESPAPSGVLSGADNITAENHSTNDDKEVFTSVSNWIKWASTPGVYRANDGWPYTLFAADLRSLAFLRIMLGVWIIRGLLVRWQEIDIWFTDEGVFPRETLMKVHYDKSGWISTAWYWNDVSFWSIYMMAGSSFQVKILFIFQACVTAIFAVGYKTKYTSILVWFLQNSLNGRVPMLSNKGDELSVRMMLWATLLPLNRVWSVDSWRRRGLESIKSNASGPPLVRSLATFGLYFQLIILYWTTGMLKNGVDWEEGYATSKAVALHQFHKPNLASIGMRNAPLLCYICTYAALYGERYCIWLMLGPSRIVMTIIALLLVMQISFYFILYLGWFPVMSMCVTLGVIPSFVWDQLLPATIDKLENIGSRFCAGFCEAIDIPTTIDSRRSNTRLSTIVRRTKRWLHYGIYLTTVACVLIPATLWTTAALKYIEVVPEPWRTIGLHVGSDQVWSMFSPVVSDDDTAVYFPAVLRDGTQVDGWPILQQISSRDELMRSALWKNTTYDELPMGYNRFPSLMWLMYVGGISRTHPVNPCEDERNPRCPRLAEFVCRKWNERFKDVPEKQMLVVKFVNGVQITRKGDCLGCVYQTPLEAQTRWIARCVDDPNVVAPPKDPYPPMLKDVLKTTSMV